MVYVLRAGPGTEFVSNRCYGLHSSVTWGSSEKLHWVLGTPILMKSRAWGQVITLFGASSRVTDRSGGGILMSSVPGL